MSGEDVRIEYSEEQTFGAGEMPQAPTADEDIAAGSGARVAYENVADSARSWRGIAAGAQLQDEQAAYSASLSGNQLALTGFSHAGAGIVAIVLGVTGLFGMFGVMASMESWGPMLLLLVTVACIVGGWVIGAVSAMVKYAGFRVVRRGNRVEVEHGALRHEFSGIDIARIQGVTIRQTFIRRLLGYCEVTLERVSAANSSASDGSADKSAVRGIVAHPFIRISEAADFVNQLVPEFAEAPQRETLGHLPACALRRALLRRCIWQDWAAYLLVVMLALYAIVGPSPVRLIAGTSDSSVVLMSDAYYFCLAVVCIICVLVIIARAVGAVLWYRGSGLDFNRRYMTIFNDGLYTKLSVIPRNKIQAGYTRANPFQSAAGVSSVRAITAAGVTETTVELWDVDAARAREWLRWLEPRNS